MWILTDLPGKRKAIGSKWVFKRKKNSDGKNITNKARLVVRKAIHKLKERIILKLLVQ